jgi:hypothetical protein
MSWIRLRPRRTHLAAVLPLLLGIWPRPAPAQGLDLLVFLTDGRTVVHPLDQILKVISRSDSVLIVGFRATNGYSMPSIQRISFTLGASGVTDPSHRGALMQSVRLLQNRPNPFQLRTEIEFSLTSPGRAELRVFAPDGRLVRTLLDEDRGTGTHRVVWDGLDDRGRRLPAGAYFYSLRSPSTEIGRRLVLLTPASSRESGN